jgi:hypothetical protein
MTVSTGMMMRSSGNRKNRRSGRAFALSGNVKFPPLAIVPAHPTCGNPSCRFSARGQPLHSSHIIRAPNEHCRG